MAIRSRPRDAIAREREGQAFELRKAGATFAAIGRQLGISEIGAIAAYRRALRRHPSPEQSAAGRAMEAARLDALQVPLWPLALKGDLHAIDRCLAIIRLRIDLLGLAAPVPKDINLFIRQVYQELRDLPEPDLLSVLGYAVNALPEAEDGGGD